jgi:hypothetical protein
VKVLDGSTDFGSDSNDASSLSPDDNSLNSSSSSEPYLVLGYQIESRIWSNEWDDVEPLVSHCVPKPLRVISFSRETKLSSYPCLYLSTILPILALEVVLHLYVKGTPQLVLAVLFDNSWLCLFIQRNVDEFDERWRKIR